MDRKKLIYAAILAVAVLALVLDRMLLSEPTSAAAAVATEPAAAPTAKAAVTIRPSDPSVEALNRLPVNETERDLFLPGPAMLRESLQSRNALAPTGPQPGSPELFAQHHRLQATYIGPAGQIAVIDGKPYELGATLDGYKLTNIQTASARLQAPQGTAILQLPEHE